MEPRVINLVEFIFESDLIEGILDDPSVLARQIETRKKDGHVGAMLMLGKLVQSPVNHGSYADKKLICSIQEMIVTEQEDKLKKMGLRPGCPPGCIGEYRDMYVRVGDSECPSPEDVAELMEKLIERMCFWQQNSRFYAWEYNLREVARFHYDLLMIHPFADGNGRTARALAYYLMSWASLKPFVFTSVDKRMSYYPCFDNPGDSRMMEKYFFKKIGCLEMA